VAVLIDPPRWPAHGTSFSHLVSDHSLEELFFFADAAGVPFRAFDHDHYDVAVRRYDDVVAAGARPVAPSELVRRLVAGGLRVRTPDRTPRPAQVMPGLRAAWHELMPAEPGLGRDLMNRWQEPHRHYHDVRHLAQLLAALAALSGGPAARPVALAAWFHDAVHEGIAGDDERASAGLARSSLEAVGLPADEVDEVVRLVLLTIEHDPDPGDDPGILLVDGDFSVLGQSPGRYHYYSRGVRLEYPQLDDRMFASGRMRALDGLFSRGHLFGSVAGREFWETQARANLDVEHVRWSKLVGAT
jgi:predicted metal-dependent HD superfamily phosphohydrolase